MEHFSELWEIREKVAEKKPLVLNITNNVVTNFTANVLLAIGASPIMSESKYEAQDLTMVSDAVVLNIGTLHPRQVEHFLAAGQLANENKKPVILDPVGTGATGYRNSVASDILKKVRLSLIRGNYGEIKFLAGAAGQTKGVDNLEGQMNIELLEDLSKRTGAMVAATGEVDYITDGEKVLTNFTGHMFLQYVTGTGCALSSFTGAFMAVSGDNEIKGVLAALAFYGAAAEKAAEISRGPGSFVVNFLDSLYSLCKTDFISILDKKVPKGFNG